VGTPCPYGEECSPNNDPSAGEFFNGTCELINCVGSNNGGKGNGPEKNSATTRVTICHRTCSETNPWVRITIDDDAWNGNGCGHQEHHLLPECAGKDLSKWGPYDGDYLLKWHGTKDEVANQFNNVAEEKAYWKKWERACPYVLSTKEGGSKCCDWEKGECCGLNPFEEPEPEPQATPNSSTADVELHKTVKRGHSSCNADGSELEYGVMDTEVTYCYRIVNSGDVDLTGVKVVDPNTGNFQETLSILGVGEQAFMSHAETITADLAEPATVTTNEGPTDTDPAGVKLVTNVRTGECA